MTILNMVTAGGWWEPMTMTIVWDEVSNPSNFFVKYDDDAAWLTQWSTDFDTFFWYSAVLLDNDWNEVEEVAQSSPWVLDMSSFNWALTWTANNVMIKFPRRWIKMSKSGSQVTLSLTKEVNKPWYQYYAFTKWNTSRAFMYLWAYKWTFSNDNSTVASSFTSWTTYMKSWATWTKTLNFSPCACQNIVNMRATAAKYGNWYSLSTIYPRWYIDCLYMLKYGNPDSQGIIWPWYTWNGGASVAPWLTNSITNATWNTDNTSNWRIKLFWLEDWWGNVSDMTDGCYFDENKNLTVDKTNSIFQSSAYSTNLWVASSWYMKTIDWSNDGMFRNTSDTAWSWTTYYADNSGAGNSRALRIGGGYGTYSSGGIFSVSPTSPSYAEESYGARLMYL